MTIMRVCDLIEQRGLDIGRYYQDCEEDCGECVPYREAADSVVVCPECGAYLGLSVLLKRRTMLGEYLWEVIELRQEAAEEAGAKLVESRRQVEMLQSENRKLRKLLHDANNKLQIYVLREAGRAG